MIAQSTASTATAGSPRSRRVAKAAPANFQLSAEDTAPPSPPPPASPPLPPRSPLRPRLHAASPAVRSSIASLEASTVHDPQSLNMLAHSPSFNAIAALVDVSGRQRAKTPDKPLPLPPPSPLAEEVDQDETSSSAPSSLHLSTSGSCQPSKRTHALLELLTSEQSYASDLALIRDIHIPLALGQSSASSSFEATTPSTPTFPNTSSPSSSRVQSTASDSSTASNSSMTVDDVKIIFSNVSDLADFSDKFIERLEEALGSVLEGGVGEDHVGALFLEMIPKLEPLYTTYITKHSAALEHLNSLPQTPSLLAYLAHTRSLAERLSHAWDLPSLLIKPVQRLLKYSLLLGAIIDATPDSHGDKESLKQAREKMEVVAHGVNEGRRRREVVREVLTGVPAKRVGEPKAKRKGLNMNVAASVSLGRMKSIKAASFKIKEGAEANQEAEQVARMGDELRMIETFIRSFMKNVTDWTNLATQMTQALLSWAVSFGKTIGVLTETNSEAFGAFVTVIETGLLPVCDELDTAISQDLLPPLKHLIDSASNPERLLEAMRTLEPLHYGLLNFNVSKSRPPTQLLDASKSYVALRAQLHAELPKYNELLRKGIEFGIGHWESMQIRFWKAIRDKWGELWDALRVDGEMKGSASETLRVWWSRFEECEARISGLNIVRPPPKDKEKDKDRDKERVKMRARGKSFTGSIQTEYSGSTFVAPSRANLSSVDIIPMSSSSSQTLVPSPTSAKSRNFDRRPSEESLHSKKSGKSSKAHKHSNSSASYQQFLEELAPLQRPSYPRTASVPISSPMPLRKSTSHGRLLDSTGESNRLRHLYAGQEREELPPEYFYEEEDDYARGRSSRKPSFKRRLTETLRPAPSSTSRHRRSPSLPSMASPQPSPNPTKTAFDVRQTPPLARVEGLYACRAVHLCEPPDGVAYRGLRFHTLRPGDIFEILEECGHPCNHPGLPLKVDFGEDCLLLARDEMGDIGWALASFLLPVD